MKIRHSSYEYSISFRLPDVLKSRQANEARRERAQNLPENQQRPSLYLGGVVKVKKTKLQHDLETAARTADERRSARTPPQASPSAAPRPPISEDQLGQVRAALDKWIHGTGSDDARVTARVKQATAFMKDVAQSTVRLDNEGHLCLFLSQSSSLSTGAHAALKTAGILLEGAASPVSSIRSQRSGDTARPLPSLPSVDPGEPALPSPSRHTAKSSMQAGPDSTPLVRINDAQLEQVRSALNAWVDAEDSGGGTSSQMIAQATSLRWKAESSVVHQGTDGRLHLFLPKMGSLPPGLVAALKTAGIDLHEADSPVPSPPSQQFPRFARPAEGRYSPPQVVPSDLVSWPNQTSGERQPWTQHYRSKLLVWAAETSDETELDIRDHVARRIIRSMRNRTSDQNVPVNLRDIAGLENLAAAPRFPELVTHVYVPANTNSEFINLLAEQNLTVLREDPPLSAVSVNPQRSA